MFSSVISAATPSIPAIVGVIVYPISTLTPTASKNLPITFAQVFKQGDVPAGKYIALRNSNTTTLPYQIDTKATYPDGSLKHAIISALIPEVSPSGNTLELYSSNVGTTSSTVKITDILSK